MRASWGQWWGARALRVSALAGMLTACSAADPGARTMPPADATATGGRVAPPPSGLPDSVPNLARLAPKEALAVLGLPSFDTLTRVIGKPSVELGLEAIAPDLEKVGVSSALAAKTLAAFDGAVISIEKERPSKPALTVIARVKDDSVIEPLVKAAKLEQIAPDRWQARDLHVAWLAKAKVAIISSSAAHLEKSLALASTQRASFIDSPLYKQPSKTSIWLAADLNLADPEGRADKGSTMRLDIDVDSGAMLWEVIQSGDHVERLSQLVAPSPQAAIAKLPSGAIGALSLSIKRAPGKGLADWLKEAARSLGKDPTAEAEEGLQKLLRLSLADVDRALGDEVAVGAYYDGKPGPDRDDLPKNGAVFGTVAIRDEKVARSVVDAIGKLSGAKPTNGAFHFEKRGTTLDVKTSKDVVSFGYGSPALLKKLSTSKTSLASSTEFATARKTGPAAVIGLAYLDIPRLLASLPAVAMPAGSPKIDPVLFVLQLQPSDLGVHYVITSGAGLGAVATLGAASAVAIYGVRRYLQSAKTSEAKNSIGAIARGAVGAYERESGAPNAPHALCKSAQAVPATVPSGKKYQPNDNAGTDYETGTPLSGWKCLRFTMTNPQYYQYDYRMGGNYKGPKRGLPDPGPNGFEASAEGDLDGDGKTSLFTLTGKVVNGMVKIAPEMNIADEYE